MSDLIKKWSSVFKSYNIEDKRKIELFSSYLENSQNKRLLINPLFQNSESNKIIILSELNVISLINIDGKAVIIRGINDNKISFHNPHPVEKFSLSIESLNKDLKMSRKDKIDAINGKIDDDPGRRVIKLISGIIAMDINERLNDGQILYIDELFIDLEQMSSLLYKPSIEFIVRYDVI